MYTVYDAPGIYVNVGDDIAITNRNIFVLYLKLYFSNIALSHDTKFSISPIVKWTQNVKLGHIYLGPRSTKRMFLKDTVSTRCMSCAKFII